MIAIIVASQTYPEMYGLDDHLPLSLFPLVDRPLLRHIVEYFVGQGIRQFEFILSHIPEKIEDSLGSGARWGCSFGFHVVPSSATAYQMVRTLASGAQDAILLGRGDCLPQIAVTADSEAEVFFLPEGAWSGWAVLPRTSAAVAALTASLENLHAVQPTLHGIKSSTPAGTIDFRSGAGILRGQQDVMEGKFDGLMIGGRQAEAGIWIARNVTLHPTVTLQAPIYIGANCRIGKGSKVGPCAVLSENCILDEQTVVENSVISPGTYIGQGLELSHVLVDRNRLINVKIGASFLVSDTFLLSSLTEQANHRIVQQLVSRFAALLLLLLFSPVVVWLQLSSKFLRRWTLYVQRAISLPAHDHSAAWREYPLAQFRPNPTSSLNRWSRLLSLLAGLISVIRGDLFLVGVQPRTRAEIEQLPKDWRSIYLKSKAGLITEAAVIFGEAASRDEIYTAEAYYSATQSFRHDLKLAALYFWSMIAGPGAPNRHLAGMLPHE